jgi:hypothetical protein
MAKGSSRRRCPATDSCVTPSNNMDTHDDDDDDNDDKIKNNPQRNFHSSDGNQQQHATSLTMMNHANHYHPHRPTLSYHYPPIQQRHINIDPRITTFGNFPPESVGQPLHHHIHPWNHAIPHQHLPYNTGSICREPSSKHYASSTPPNASAPAAGPIVASPTSSYHYINNNPQQQPQYCSHPTYSTPSNYLPTAVPIKISQDQLIKNQHRQGAGSILMSGLFHRGGSNAPATAISSTSTGGGHAMHCLTPKQHVTTSFPVVVAPLIAPATAVSTSSIQQQPPLVVKQQPTPQPQPQPSNVEAVSTTHSVKRKISKAQPRPQIHVPPRAFGPVYNPNHNDVLCGRGGAFVW